MTTFSKTESARQAVTLTVRRGGAILLAGLAAAVVFISCDDMLPDDAAMLGAEAADEVVFSAGGPAFSTAVSTKASVVSSLPSFHVACTRGVGSETSVWENTVFVSDGAPVPTYRGGRFWPVNDPGYHFFASNAPLSFGADGTAATVDGSTDVVCAYLPEPAYKMKNSLSFEHIFARVGQVTVTADDSYDISDVSVTIVPKTSGTYNLRTGAGKKDGTGWSETVASAGPSTIASAESIARGGSSVSMNDIYLIPGTYELTATWTAKRGEYVETFTGKTARVSLVAGEVNKLTTTLSGHAAELEFGVEITPWGKEMTDVDFPLVYDPSKGHSYIDLGLRKTVDGTVYKVLFADVNVGAFAPEDQGDYYAFGETTKSSGTRSSKDYNWENCPFHTGSDSNTGWSKYIPSGKESYSVSGTTDNKLVLDKCDDAASTSWGGAWRTPSPEEFCMLLNGDGTDLTQDKLSVVSYHWVDNYNGSGVNGLLVQGTGLFSSSSVFLPACGYCEGRRVTAMDSGEYWTREILSHSPEFAASFGFINGSQITDFGSRRFEGRQIRPVLVLPD